MRSLALAAVLLLAPAVALAGGYAVPNVSARDLSMAGSLHAAQNDAGAVFVNPAALSRLDGLSLSLSASIIDNGSSWTSIDGTQTASQYFKPAWPPAVYAGYGMPLSGDMRVGFGLGMTIPFGGNVFWPADWPGRFNVLTVDRKIYGTFFTGGVQLAKWIRVGGGLIWYRGTEKLEQRVNFLSTETTASLTASGNHLSYDLSLEADPLPGLRVGVDYKHKADMTLTGDATFGGAPAPFTFAALNQGVTHQLTMPNYFAVGAAYQIIPEVLATFAFTFDRFIIYDKDVFAGDAGANVIIPRHYKNGHTFRLGTEITPVEKLKVRLGVLRDISPTPAEWLDPSIPDSNVWGGSIGLGYTVKPGLDVNVAYFHAWFDTVTTPPGPNGQYLTFTPGTYKPFAHIGSIGVSWQPEKMFGKISL